MNKKLFSFVLMPFDDAFDDVYKLGIQEAAKEVGIKAERLDEQIFDGNMLDKIYQEIDNADLIIADMSTRNPNVFYEVGYADARNKLIILITNNYDDIPFDLLHRPHIIYNDSITTLRSELIERLEWAKSEIVKRNTEPILIKVKIRNSTIERTEYSDIAELNFRFEIHNISSNPITNIHTFFIYTGNEWSAFYDDKQCKHTDSEIEPYKIRHIIRPDFNTLPEKNWLPIDIKMRKRVYTKWKEEAKRDSYELSGVLRIEMLSDSYSFKSEESINTIVEYDDLPF